MPTKNKALSLFLAFIMICSLVQAMGPASKVYSNESENVQALSMDQENNGMVGVNLSDGRPFVDVMKSARYLDGAVLDQHGWPTNDAGVVFFDYRPFGAWMGESEIDDPEKFQLDVSGTYKLSFTGQADLAEVEGGFAIANKQYDSGSNRTTADLIVPADKALVVINFENTKRLATDEAGTGITDIKLIRPGYDPDTTEVFSTEFKDSLEPFSTLRTMDWTLTNDDVDFYGLPEQQRMRTWAQRKLPSTSIQVGRIDKAFGIAWEYIIQLANETGKDIWINVPVGANDDYVTELAELFKNELDSSINVYVEYGNEIWNWSFLAATYNQMASEAEVAAGSVLNNDGNTDRYTWGARRVTKRTIEISNLFKDVFGEGAINNQVRVVYAWHNMQSYNAAQALNWANNTYGALNQYLYSVSIAPYLHFNQGANANATVSEIISQLHDRAESTKTSNREYQVIAASHNLVLTAYEGNVHGDTGNTTNLANFIQANRAPEIREVLLHAVRDSWFEVGGGLYMFYHHVGYHSRYGSWGLTDDAGNTDTYKYQAAKELTQYNVSIDGNLPTPSELSVQAVTHNQVTLRWTLAEDEAGIVEYKVLQNGVEVASTPSLTQLTISNLTPNTHYQFVVQARNAGGQTADSNTQVVATERLPHELGLLTGEPFGVANPGNSILNAFDHDMTTVFQGPKETSVGIDLGEGNASRVTKIRFLPEFSVSQPWLKDRSEGLYYGSVDGENYVQIAYSGSANDQGWSEATITSDAEFRYFRFTGSEWYAETRFAEIQFFGEAPDLPDPPPTAPVLSIGNVTASSVALQWTASASESGIDSYIVYRDGAQIATTSNHAYTATGLQEGTAYRFHIIAKAVDGQLSEASNERNVTTMTTAPIGDVVLQGDVFGAAQAHLAFDGNEATVFQGPGQSVLGIDLGEGKAAKLAQIRFLPVVSEQEPWLKDRASGIFQASMDGETYVQLASFLNEPLAAWNEIAITNTNPYRYFRFVGSQYNGEVRIVDIEFIGTLQATETPEEPGNGGIFEPNPNKRLSPVGINVAGLADWASQQPFKDVFKTARGWNNDNPAGLDLDDNGWVRSLQPGQSAYALMLFGDDYYPSGQFVVLYDGEGEMTFDWGASKISETPGRILINVTDGIRLNIVGTNPDNYIRNIRVMRIEFEDNYENEPFHPLFLEWIDPFNVVRYMNFMSTNGSPVVTWEDRRTPDYYTQATNKGIAVEHMIELSNLLKADPWFTLPHAANDDYVENFATYIRDHLDPDLNIYIEWSNETWNASFVQYQYAVNQGRALGYTGSDMAVSMRYHSHRAKQVFEIFEEVFGAEHDRVVNVLGGFHHGGSYHTNIMLEHENVYEIVDALAIAPYFGHSYGGSKADLVKQWSLDQLFEDMSLELNDALARAEEVVVAAAQYGVPVIGYEGGQHLVGVYHNGVEYYNDEQLNAKLLAANRDPRMGQIYTDYLNKWKDIDGRLMVLYSFIAQPSKWGSWGIIEHMAQNPDNAPKYKAVVDFINNNEKWWDDNDTPTGGPGDGFEWGQAESSKIASAITIDGLLNEATWTIEHEVAKVTNGEPNNEVTFGTLWDDQYLYVGVKIVDHAIYSDSSQVYQDDSIEIYIDGNHDRADSYSQTFDRQFIIGANGDQLFESQGRTTGVLFASQLTDDGYTVEIAIPWSNFGVTDPQPGTVIGLDIGNNDDDSGGNRDSQLLWSGDGDNWQSTRRFGDLTLISDLTDEPVEESFGEPVATLEGPDSAVAGSAFTLTAGIDELTSSFTIFDVVIDYDPSAVVFATEVDVEGNFILADGVVTSLRSTLQVLGSAVKPDIGEARVILAAGGAGETVSGNGPLFTLAGSVKAGASAGITTISLQNVEVSRGTLLGHVEGAAHDIAIALANKAELSDAIAGAQATLSGANIGTAPGEHPESAAQALEHAIAAATLVLENEAASQETVNEAITNLDAAAATFLATVNPGMPPANKSQLQAAISQAEARHVAAATGAKVGQYSSAAKQALEAAITAANAVNHQTSASQAAVDQAVITLQAALNHFLDQVVTLIAGQTRISIRDLAYAAQYYGVKTGDTNWSEIEAADINGVDLINVQVLAAIARLILDDWLQD